MNYNKENSRSALEYLGAKKWGKFLLAIPPGAPRGYIVDGQYVQVIRIRASQISKDADSDRMFTVNYNDESGVLTITSTLKNNDQAN